MAWSIVEVARMAKVSSRTLRHYHDIGLLLPAYVGTNGYRYYQHEQLLRLQQILLLRELDLGLEAISEVLAGHRDQTQVLRQHEQWLRSEQHRLGRLADTVAHTITSLEGGTAMSAPELFEGFADRQAQAEQALAGRYGEGVREHFATARERTKAWSQKDYLDAQQQAEQLDSEVLELMRAGVAPETPAGPRRDRRALPHGQPALDAEPGQLHRARTAVRRGPAVPGPLRLPSRRARRVPARRHRRLRQPASDLTAFR